MATAGCAQTTRATDRHCVFAVTTGAIMQPRDGRARVCIGQGRARTLVMPCPCGSELEYDHCCGPYLGGDKLPPTAEALMRSRYTAYATGDMDYLARTLAPESRSAFDAAAAKARAAQVKWRGLNIHFVDRGGPGDAQGVVAFVATFEQGGKTMEHHEVSQFRREGGAWLFVSGDTSNRPVGQQPQVSTPQAARQSAPKVGRNDPCPCGSGKKYKMCCGR